jgi:hypothetical protein
MKTDDRVLKNIVRLLPSPQAREAAEHLPGEFEEPLAGVINEEGLRPLVALLREINQALELCIRTD